MHSFGRKRRVLESSDSEVSCPDVNIKRSKKEQSIADATPPSSCFASSHSSSPTRSASLSPSPPGSPVAISRKTLTSNYLSDETNLAPTRPVRTFEECRLNQAKERITYNQIPQRSTKLLDNPPAPRFPRSRGMQTQIASSSGLKLLNENPCFNDQPTKSRREKLADIAIRDRERLDKSNNNLESVKKQTALPVAKITPRNRQDLLFESLSSTIPPKSREEVRAHPPPPLPQNTEMPLTTILRDMDKPQIISESAAPVLKEFRVQQQKSLSSSSGSSRGNHQQNTATSTSQTVSVKKFGEDRVYRDILLNWKPEWLDVSTRKGAPPVHGNLELITLLPNYKGDFKCYFETFHPLMLHELWSSIVQDYQKQSRQKNHRVIRSGGSCEFEIGIELIEEIHRCPLIGSEDKRLPTQEPPFWHAVHVYALTDKHGFFNKELDFGKLCYDIRVGDMVVKKEVFFFSFPSSDRYEEIKEGTHINNNLLQNKKFKYKYSMQIITHLKNKANIILENTCKIEKISYIRPKIQDFRSFARFPDSTLSKLILNPEFSSSQEIYDPNKTIPAAELVRHVSTMLNPIQRGIVHHTWTRILRDSRDLLLWFGPPGTGKTKTIVGLVLQLLLSCKHNKPKILICTPSNQALDELIRRFDKVFGADIKMVRVGHACSPDVKKYTIDERVKAHYNKYSKSERISEAIIGIDNKISALEEELDKMRHQIKNEVTIATRAFAIEELKKQRKLYKDDLQKVQTNRKNLDAIRKEVLGEANVVFSTLNSCYTIKKDLITMNKKCAPVFKCCIIDEAAQTTEPESLAPLSLRCENLILVGDPKQLPATVLSSEAERRLFGQSLFTRLFNFYDSGKSENLKSPVMMLTQQYRMHPSILRWPNLRFYSGKLETNDSVLSDPKRKLRIRPYLFLNVKGKELNESRQISNSGEMIVIQEILKILQNLQSMDKNHEALSIGIISPYYDQKIKLQELVAQSKGKDLSTKFAETIEIETVDGFQGREKDIILMSCVRTFEVGFLKTKERLNVALTRAKMSLIIIGDAECLDKNEMWKSLMNDAATNGVFQSIPDYKDKDDNYLHRLLEQKLIVPSNFSPDKI